MHKKKQSDFYDTFSFWDISCCDVNEFVWRTQREIVHKKSLEHLKTGQSKNVYIVATETPPK